MNLNIVTTNPILFICPLPCYKVEEWAKNTGIKEVNGIDSSLLNDDRTGNTLDVVNGSRSIS